LSTDTGGAIALRTQLLVYAVAFFTGSQVLIVSVLLPLWALSLDASPVVIGLIISARQVLVVAFSIHGGALQDRFGPRAVIIVMGIAGAAVYMLYPLTPTVWGTIALQMVSGFLEVTGWIGAQTLVGGLLRGEPVYAGRMTAATRLGGFCAPILAGLSWQYFGPGFAFVATAGWVLVGTAIAWMLPDTRPKPAPAPPAPTAEAEPTPKPTPAARTVSKGRSMLPSFSDYVTAFRLLALPAVALVIACTFMRQAGSGVQNSFYGVWLKQVGFDAGAIGLLLGISNGVSAFAALTVGWFSKRVKGHWLLIAMTMMAVVAIAVTPLLGTFFALAVAIGLRGVGQGYNFPLMLTIASRAVGPELQGRVAALRISFNKFGSSLVPFFMGAVAEFAGLEAAFYLIGAIGVVALMGLGVWAARSPAFRTRPPGPG
jgi:MFS family permease